MSFFSWLQGRTSIRSPRGQSQRQSAARHFRPRLESLEYRWMPSTLTVTNNLDSRSGSLRYEIAHAKNNDTIVFAPVLDGQTITLTRGELAIAKSLTIKGPGANLLTVSGGQTSRVFEVDGGTVTVTGLTISNGNGVVGGITTASRGGAILNFATLTVSGCTLSGNTADFGGGIFNGGTLTVTGCTLSGNSASIYGGGIYNLGPLALSGCTLSSNTASDGGAVYNGNTLSVSGCTVSDNVAYVGAGGGIYNLSSGTLTVSNSVFSSNNAYGAFHIISFGKYTDGGGNTFS